MLRSLYSFIFYLILPIIFLRLYWRGFNIPECRLRWGERLGFYSHQSKQNVIWFHAVSVGEAESIFPLVKQFMLNHPESHILITTMTPAGTARVKAIMGETVEHVYLPYDIPCAVRRFLTHFKPQKAIIMETEIWLNLFTLTNEQNIPLFIVNARLSVKAYKNYQKLPAFILPALNAVTVVASQTEADTKRFKNIGAENLNVQTLGNLKFDVQIATETIKQGQQLKKTLFAQRFVWIIASTHKNEEAIFFELYPELKKQIPQLLLLVVPRHPERFNDIETQARGRNLQIVRRSLGACCDVNIDVYLADTLGELKMLYAASDIAFVGGSLFSHLGGHNVLEPTAVGIPVMFGGNMSNFKAIETGILSAQAAIQCQDSTQISEALLKLYQQVEYRQQLSINARHFLKQNQGAMLRVLKILGS